MNELANELAAATLRQIEQNNGKWSHEILDMVNKTGKCACWTDGTCENVRKLAELLRDWVIKAIKVEKGPGLSGWTAEVLEALVKGFSLYLVD